MTWMYVLWFAVIALAVVGSIVFNVVRMKKLKNATQNFLAQNPNAAKVYLNAGYKVVSSDAVSVHLVDGGEPILFNKGTKAGFYVAPGAHTVEISYTHNRAGVIYRNVSTTTGSVQKTIAVEPGKEYSLGFDKKQGEFVFTELAPGQN
ncbi:MAG: hypothetical protein ACK5L3_06505 [Oscillospiraceae bacterium]